jgi:hypothetical protein
MQDLTCTIALYIKASCSSHHYYPGGKGPARNQESRVSIVFTPVTKKPKANPPPSPAYRNDDHLETHPPLSYNPSASYSGLLASNRKIRQEFIGVLGKDLQLDLVGSGGPCTSCDPFGPISDLVHEPWRALVKTIKVVILCKPVAPGESLCKGFPALRKICLPEVHLGDRLTDTRIARRSPVVQKFDAGPLELASKNVATDLFRRRLQHYGWTTTSPSGIELESWMTVGATLYIFVSEDESSLTLQGDVAVSCLSRSWRDMMHDIANAGAQRILVKKESDGRISTDFVLTDR